VPCRVRPPMPAGAQSARTQRLLGRAIILGMTLDAVIYEGFGSISQFVFSLPVARVLPRKSPWVRGFFDLQEQGRDDHNVLR
jgi:hypothetical protein